MWNTIIDGTPSELILQVWADADTIDGEALTAVFNSANALCTSFAPPLEDGSPIPAAYLLAEIFQARHIWSSFQGSNRQMYGPDGDGITTTTWTLVLQARDLLRPRTSPLGRLR